MFANSMSINETVKVYKCGEQMLKMKSQHRKHGNREHVLYVQCAVCIVRTVYSTCKCKWDRIVRTVVQYVLWCHSRWSLPELENSVQERWLERHKGKRKARCLLSPAKSAEWDLPHHVWSVWLERFGRSSVLVCSELPHESCQWNNQGIFHLSALADVRNSSHFLKKSIVESSLLMMNFV